MKKAGVIGLLVLTVAAVSFATYDYFRSGEQRREDVITTTIRSEVLGQERELIIHLPKNYDSTQSYPVAYVLDGSSQDDHIADKFDSLSSAGQVPKTIVVGIPNMTGRNRQFHLTPPFLRTDNDKADSPLGEGDKFLSFMDTELFPFMEQHYRASQTRLFMGHSRGGLVVMYSLLYKPQMFRARFCYSAPFWRQDDLMASKVGEFLGTNDTLQTFLYLSAGDAETENIKSGLQRMTTTLKERAPHGFVWHSEYTPKADHQSNPRISAAIGIAKWGAYVKR